MNGTEEVWVSWDWIGSREMCSLFHLSLVTGHLSFFIYESVRGALERIPFNSVNDK